MQFDWGTIDPNTTSGGELAAYLDSWKEALHSGHRGPERPNYVLPGMQWIKEVSGSTWELYLFTGSADVLLGSIDVLTGRLTISPSGSQFLSIPTLPDEAPTNPRHVASKGYVDGQVAPMLPRSGGIVTGPITLQQPPTAAGHATPKSYVDAMPAVKTGVFRNGWNGYYDLSTGVATTFFDQALPANTDVVMGSGWLRGLQQDGSDVSGLFDVLLVTDGEAISTSSWFTALGSNAQRSNWFQSGGAFAFNVPEGNSGWKLRFRGWRDANQGPFVLLTWNVSGIFVVR